MLHGVWWLDAIIVVGPHAHVQQTLNTHIHTHFGCGEIAFRKEKRDNYRKRFCRLQALFHNQRGEKWRSFDMMPRRRTFPSPILPCAPVLSTPVYLSCALSVHAARAVVDTNLGTLVGRALPDGGSAFFGIPYALPPLGQLRFEPPVPLASWGSGKRTALEFGAECMQSTANNPSELVSEHGTLGSFIVWSCMRVSAWQWCNVSKFFLKKSAWFCCVAINYPFGIQGY